MKVLLKSAIILFVSFLLARFIFFLSYTLPTQPSINEIFYGFLQGLRFDLAGIAITLLFPFLILYTPWLGQKLYWRKFAVYLQLLLIVQIWLLFFADFYFYPESKKRLGYEAFVYLNKNIFPIVGTVFSQHKLLLFSFLLLVAVGIYFINKNLQKDISSAKPVTFSRSTIEFVLIFLLLLIAARGGSQRVPLRPGDSFISANQSLNHSVLSSPFNVFYTLAHASGSKKYMASEKAESVVLQNLKFSKQHSLSSRFPLYKLSEGPKEAKKYNIIVLLMESWTAKYTGIHGEASYTPNFNKILPKAVVFPNFFASGVRTTNGLYSVLMGMPDQSSIPMMMRSGLQSRHTSISRTLKRFDYTNLFIHGGPLDFDNLRPMVTQEGFDIILGKEDFKNSGGVEKVWGYDDEFIFARSIEEIKKLSPPYFTYLLSVTSHAPYELPPNFKPYFSDPGGDHKKVYLNALHYSDWSLGKFLDIFESDPKFKNTVLVITGDHTYHGHELNYFENMNVPLVIYAPGILKPEINMNLGTHADILPTIMSLIGHVPIASLGTNLFSQQNEDIAKYFINGIDIGVITKNHIAFKSVNDKPPLILDYKMKDFSNDVGPANPALQADLKEKIEAYYQFSTELVEENRLSP